MRLQQILINLGGNAIKFTGQGEVVVQFKVVQQTDRHTTLRIAVSDTGIGIAPENLTRIFDGFSQAEASTTRRFGGTGLGLSICKRLVELMGGKLQLDSTLGQGSCFHFTVALAHADEALADGEKQMPRVPSAMHVLVVDDNVVAGELLAAMAESWGWQVDVAHSGAQALVLLEARANAGRAPYDAVFVDWLMPDMDGWETIARMRLMGAQAHSPITVMVTAHGREMLSQRSAQEQACLNAFLIKPITASMLYDSVADARAGVSNLRAKPRAQSNRAGRLKGLRLLVVEDNLINQQVARELLTGEGALVEIAGNGQLGVTAVAGAKPPFDAVLMDIQMPVMDGYVATAVIRRELGLATLPVIAMTANAMASDREACLRAGMDDHVGKPFDLPHLVDVLLLHTRRARGAPLAPRWPGAQTPLLPETIAASAPEMPAVDCIDTQAAIARLAGNTKLYASILRSYLEELATQPDQIGAFLRQGNLAGAARLLHTCKGVSASVGAIYMSAIARAAESAVRDVEPMVRLNNWLTRFREAASSTARAMGPLVRELAPDTEPATTLAGHATTRATGMQDTSTLLADLGELRTLLGASDLRALDVHGRLHVRPPGAADLFAGLDAAIRDFDFAQGAAQCARLISALGGEHDPG